MKRAADVNSTRNKKEKKSHRSPRVKSPGNKALTDASLTLKENGKLRTTKDGGGGRTAAIVSPAKSFVDAKSSSTSQLNVAGVHDSHVDDSDTNIIVIDPAKKRKKSSLIASSKSSKGKKSPSISSSKFLSSKLIEFSIDAPKSSLKGKESIKAPKSLILYGSEKLSPYQIDWLDSGATTRELLKYCKYAVDLPISQEDQLTALMGNFTLSELKTALVVTSCAVGGSAITSCMPNNNARKETVIKIFLSLIYDHRCMMYDTENQDGYR
jgi:hypothetical protein